MASENRVYEDEFEEFRARANSGGALPVGWRRRRTHSGRMHVKNDPSEDIAPCSQHKGPSRHSFTTRSGCCTQSETVLPPRKSSLSSSGKRPRSDNSVKRKAVTNGSRQVQPPASEENVSKANGGSAHRTLSLTPSLTITSNDEPPVPYHELYRRRSARDRMSSSDRDYFICNKQFEDFNLNEQPMRPRVSTMPSNSELAHLRGKHKTSHLSVMKSGQELRRVRSFKITSKGVVRGKESYVIRNSGDTGHSPSSMTSEERFTFDWVLRNGSVSSLGSSQSEASNEHKIFNVAVLGSHDVGKKSLIHRFIDSSGPSTNSSFDDEGDKNVSVLLDEEESTLEFTIRCSKDPDSPLFGHSYVDAYVIVYSVVDRKSFQDAIDLLFDLHQMRRQVAVILVANKTDLVRSRDVMEEEGKAAAEAYECKYAEVSAVLMHHVDELLVGILKQIRLIEKQKVKHRGKCRPAFGGDDTCCLATKQGLIGRLLGAYQSKSCDNLLVL